VWDLKKLLHESVRHTKLIPDSLVGMNNSYLTVLGLKELLSDNVMHYKLLSDRTGNEKLLPV
jgi:hypothetical protein